MSVFNSVPPVPCAKMERWTTTVLQDRMLFSQKRTPDARFHYTAHIFILYTFLCINKL